MARIARRRLLKLSGSGAVAAQTGALAAILATGRAPAFAQETTIHWLRWADFVPASDVLLKGQITQECKRRPASRSGSKPSTPTTCSRASPRRSSRNVRCSVAIRGKADNSITAKPARSALLLVEPLRAKCPNSD
jgi:hypothetical protein